MVDPHIVDPHRVIRIISLWQKRNIIDQAARHFVNCGGPQHTGMTVDLFFVGPLRRPYVGVSHRDNDHLIFLKSQILVLNKGHLT